MNTVIILRGLPGSGKSTFVKMRFPNSEVCSADDYFLVDGKYQFIPEMLPEAHRQCLKKFTNLLAGGAPHIVVDNTNINAWEVAPYYQLAKMYEYEVLIMTVNTRAEKCAARNVHGVPALTIGMMAANMAREKLPPFWQHVVLEEGQF